MIFHQIKEEGVTPVSSEVFSRSEAPYTLFLGGLLHLNGISIDKGLPTLLRDLVGNPLMPIYIATFDEDKRDVGRTAQQMYQYQKDGVPTSEARTLVNQIFPRDEKGNLLPKTCSNMRLIAYSYGTSLVQQMEQILTASLKVESLADLERVCCVNIGPVAVPREISFFDNENSADFPSNFNRLGKCPSKGIHFQQLTFLRATDQVMKDVIGNQLIPARPHSPHFVFSSSSGASCFIGEDAGDEMIRRIGIGRFPSGIQVAKIGYELDCEGHSLRLYTNEHTRNTTSGGDFAIYPSSSLGPFIRQAIRAMSGSFEDFKTAKQELQNQWVQQQDALLKSLTAKQNEFSAHIATHRTNLPPENVAFVKEVLQSVPLRTRDSKKPGPQPYING